MNVLNLLKIMFTKMIIKKAHILVFLFSMCTFHIYGQISVSGTVTDEKNEPIPGVNIDVEETEDGTVSDQDGNFQLTVSPDNVLVFTFIGYESQKIIVGKQTKINVKLNTDTKKLDEVVVIGYGTAKKSDLAGAVSQVSSDSYKDTPVIRVESALQGRAAGISVAGGGQPGDAIKVRVRGVNSVTGDNNPLVVVDGVFGGDLKSINPNDIASMEILKDASALAIYGSRGSNGVILVTTKKGKGGKTKFLLNQFVTISSLAKKIERISSAEFARYKNTEETAKGNAAPFTSADIARLNANPIDWEDLITRTGFGNNTQLSMRGSANKFNYFVSGNYMKQEGILTNTDYNRMSLRANIGVDVNDRLNINLNIYGSREVTLNDQNAFERYQDGSFFLRALGFNPASPVKDENGNYIYRSNYGSLGWNPIYSLTESKHEVTGDRLNATLNGSYKILSSLKYSLVANVGRYNSNTESLRWEKDPAGGVGSNFNFLNFNNYKSTSYQISNILNWTESFDIHNLNITGVYEVQGERNTVNNYFTNDVDVPGFYQGDDGNNEFFTNNGSQSSIQSYLGRLQYNYNSKLFITGSIRVDESSKFAKGYRVGYFPSTALAYSFGQVDEKYLTFLKVRAGWGQVGSENVTANATLTLPNNGFYSFEGVKAVNGQTITQIGTPNLTWETTTQYNAGVDFELFDRVTGTVDFYLKTTKDLLLRTTIPGTTLRKYENAGEVENLGLDFSISSNIISKDNFTWSATLNLSLLENKITSLTGGLNKLPGDNEIIGGTQDRVNVFQVGKPVGAFNGYTFLGTWKTAEKAEFEKYNLQAGDPKYLRDKDGNLVVGPIGNGIPTVTWGFNNTLEYKNWDLNIFITAASGFSVYNFVAAALNGNTAIFRDNLSLSKRNEWTSENETEVPRNGHTNRLNSSRWVEDGSYVRLSNVKLGYNFKRATKWLENIEVYASGQNLLLFTGYSGYDPEVSSPALAATGTSPTSDNASGLDTGAYPNPRVYTIGLKIEF